MAVARSFYVVTPVVYETVIVCTFTVTFFGWDKSQY